MCSAVGLDVEQFFENEVLIFFRASDTEFGNGSAALKKVWERAFDSCENF